MKTRAPARPEGAIAVRFTADHEVQDEHRGTPRATVYRAGERHALRADSAAHFISRGKAVAIGAAAEAAP